MVHKLDQKLAKFQLNKLECTVIYNISLRNKKSNLAFYKSIDMYNDISSCERLINKSPKSNIHKVK